MGAGDIVQCCGDGLVAGRAFSGVGEKTVHVVATLVAVPAIRRSLHKGAGSPSPCSVGHPEEAHNDNDGGGPWLRFLLGQDDAQHGVLHLCAALAASGVDPDESACSAEPARLYDADACC